MSGTGGRRGAVTFAPVKETAKQRRERVRAERSAARVERQTGVFQELLPTTRMPATGWDRPKNLRVRRVFDPLPHRDSSAITVGVFPFLAETGSLLRGAYVGVNELSRGAHCFDPWTAYTDGIVRNNSVVLVGNQGSGKSMLAKSLASRLMALGRHVAVPNDPNGEWARVASWCGGKTVAIGPGRNARLNLLEVAAREPGETVDAYIFRARQQQAATVRTVISILRGSSVFEPVEYTVIDETIRALYQHTTRLTLGQVYEELLSPTGTNRAYQQDSDNIRHALRRLVEGDMAGFFDSESTISFDVDSPMMTVDTSALQNASAEMKALSRLATSNWIKTATQGSAARPRLLVHEEAAIELLNEVATAGSGLADKVHEIKIARHLGLANLYIFHRFADLDALGDAGSAMRARAEQLIAGCHTRIVYGQSTEDLNLTQQMLAWNDNLIRRVSRLRQGEGVWQVGNDRVSVVRNVVTDTEYVVFNTDGLAGKRRNTAATIPETGATVLAEGSSPAPVIPLHQADKDVAVEAVVGVVPGG